jgi:hypothetical protein
MQHPNIKISFSKLRKHIKKTPTANIIFNGERPNSSSLILGKIKEIKLLSLPLKHAAHYFLFLSSTLHPMKFYYFDIFSLFHIHHDFIPPNYLYTLPVKCPEFQLLLLYHK